MKKDVQSKREREKEMVTEMIKIYCKSKHHSKELCPKCQALNEYARMRSDKCPFMETKTFCSNCKTHCYKADMKEQIKEVMKFSGPRMIFYHPVAAMRHVLETKKEKKDVQGGIRMDLKKVLYIVVGCLGVAMGAVGAVLPLLPAFPFLLLAAICFGKGSERLNSWFLNSKLYKENLELFIKGQGMTKKTKIKIMITVTVLMSIGFTFLRNIAAGQIILIGVWIFHILYFMFGIKTIRPIS